MDKNILTIVSVICATILSIVIAIVDSTILAIICEFVAMYLIHIFFKDD